MSAKLAYKLYTFDVYIASGLSKKRTAITLELDGLNLMVDTSRYTLPKVCDNKPNIENNPSKSLPANVNLLGVGPSGVVGVNGEAEVKIGHGDRRSYENKSLSEGDVINVINDPVKLRCKAPTSEKMMRFVKHPLRWMIFQIKFQYLCVFTRYHREPVISLRNTCSS